MYKQRLVTEMDYLFYILNLCKASGDIESEVVNFDGVKCCEFAIGCLYSCYHSIKYSY